jgi:hypothetical protein
MDKKTIKSLIYKAASLLLLAIFLCTSVFIYLQKSFGWFSDNDEVSASGLSVQSGSGAAVNISMSYQKNGTGDFIAIDSSLTAPIFKDLNPGDKIALKLSFKNNESSVRYLSLSMLAPTAENEKPIMHNSNHEVTTDPNAAVRYHYFGSQIRINSVGEKEINKYLLETTPLTGGFQQTYYEKANSEDNVFNKTANTTDIQLVPYTQGASNNFALAGNGATTDVIIVFEFVDNSTIQNAYINFGASEDQVCKRTLYCTFEEN